MSTARCIDCDQSFWRDDSEAWKRRCLRCWLATKKDKTPDLLPANVEAMHREFVENLPALVRLCHPDRHAGSTAATRITQWLLDVRRRVRQDESVAA